MSEHSRPPLKSRLLACFCHLSGAISARFLPLNIFVTTALASGIKKDLFAKNHAAQAADFNMSFTLYILGGALVYALLSGGASGIIRDLYPTIPHAELDALIKKMALVLLGIVTLIYVGLVVVGSIRALLGHTYRYPFSLGWYQRMEKAMERKSENNP